jgi:hypothetical protein
MLATSDDHVGPSVPILAAARVNIGYGYAVELQDVRFPEFYGT